MNNLMLLKILGTSTNKTYLTNVDLSSRQHDKCLEKIINLAHLNNDDFALQAPTKKAFEELEHNYEVASLEEILTSLTQYYNEEQDQ